MEKLPKFMEVLTAYIHRVNDFRAVASFDTWVWHGFLGVLGTQNEWNVLVQLPIFNDVLRESRLKLRMKSTLLCTWGHTI